MKRLKFNHRYIRTPIDTLNIVGAGGIYQSTITEIWGINHSGKSAFAYQTSGLFLKDNPLGFVTILDCENSTDYVRLKSTFDLDMDRLVVEGDDPSLEGCFETISKICKYSEAQVSSKLYYDDFLNKDVKEIKKLCDDNKLETSYTEEDGSKVDYGKQDMLYELLYKGILRPRTDRTPHLIIWDTIAASLPRADIESFVGNNDATMAKGYAATTMKPRIMTKLMNQTLSLLYQKPVTIFLLNQVSTTGFGTFKGCELTSTGGNALKHAIHYRLEFEKVSPILSPDKKKYVGTNSRLSIGKSKFSPKVNKIPVLIDDTKGGKIINDNELAKVARDLGILRSSGAWWYFSEVEDEKARFGKSRRWADNGKDLHIEDDSEVREICRHKIAEFYRSNYITLDETYKIMNSDLGSSNIYDNYFSTESDESESIPVDTNTSNNDFDASLVDQVDESEESC